MDGKDLLLRIIQERPSSTTFHIAKLAYLFDLMCVYALGHQASSIKYLWWQHGPYSPTLERTIWDLEEEGKIEIRSHTTFRNYDCRLHLPIVKDKPYFQKPEEDLLRFVIKRYSAMKTEQLKSVVYDTPNARGSATERSHETAAYGEHRRSAERLPQP